MTDTDAGDKPTEDDSRTTADNDADTTAESNTRDVVVPLSLYKIVIVFSTLLAIIGVVSGFIVLDAATDRANAPVSEIDPGLAVLGLVLIAGGGGIYAFATRFRAEGMGKAKTNDGKGANNG